MRRFVMLLSILAACDSGNGDDTVTTDAKKPTGDGTQTGDGTNPDDNTSCANPIATSTEGPVTISGVTSDGSLDSQGNNVGGVTVSAFNLSSSTAQGTTTSEDPSGIYQVVADNGKPVDYVQLDKSGFVSTRFFPQAPIKLSQSLKKLPLFTTAELQAYATQAGQSGLPVVAIVADCTGSLKQGATITAPSGATVKYFAGDQLTGTSTDSSGAALIFGLTGTATLGATTSGGTPYHAHAITVDSTHFALVTISER